MSKNSKLIAFDNDEIKNLEQRALLWDFLNKNYNLVNAQNIEIFLASISLTYQYFEDFIAFAKLKDIKICMTFIPVNDLCGIAKIDIDNCVRSYCNNTFYKPPILCVYHEINDNKHGDIFREVYLMFLCKDEKSLLDLFFKFEKLKVFL